MAAFLEPQARLGPVNRMPNYDVKGGERNEGHEASKFARNFYAGPPPSVDVSQFRTQPVDAQSGASGNLLCRGIDNRPPAPPVPNIGVVDWRNCTIEQGTFLNHNYQVLGLIGQGTYGKVYEAQDLRNNKLVAIKVVHQEFQDAGAELRVLEAIRSSDPEHGSGCILIRDHFSFQGLTCLVMDMHSASLYDFALDNESFPGSQIQSFALQLFLSVAFLHDLHIIHTDLKPGNIVLVDANYQKLPYLSPCVRTYQKTGWRKVLLNTEIRIIDFGCACFQSEAHPPIVTTRYYRAPEIILGLGWSFPCDIWSIGCILVELFTGAVLFRPHDDREHLAMMEAFLGGRVIPRTGKRRYSRREISKALWKSAKTMKKMSDTIPDTSEFLRQFIDLLKCCFTYDPSKRITARKALEHPFFRQISIDDGTVVDGYVRTLYLQELERKSRVLASYYDILMSVSGQYNTSGLPGFSAVQ